MRIAVIGSRGIPAHYGGFETFAQELAPRLVELGHDVTVYARRGYTGAESPSTFRGVRVVHTPYLRNRALETPSHEFTSIVDALRRGHDCFYFLGTRSSPLYVALRATRKPIVVHTDGIEWRRRKWGPAGRAYLRGAEWLAARFGADALVTDAEAMRRYYLQRYARDSVCIPYGADVVRQADPSLLAPFRLEPGGYHLVVSRLEPENNVDVIIREFLASASPRSLAIVGGTNYRTDYTRSLSAAAADGRVRLLGAVYGGDLSALRFHAFSYVHGHEVGGTNPSLLEAMGCGNRCLALDTEFNREALGDAGLYWSARRGDLAGLVGSVEADPGASGKLGILGRERIERRYRWEAVAEAHDRLFAEVAGA